MFDDRWRALLFADANFLAHVSRSLEVARVLRAEFGVDVAFAGSGPYMTLPAQDGFATYDCYTVPKERTLVLARRALLMNPLWWQREVARSIRSDVEVIGRAAPDVVVGDMHWSLRAAAVETGRPYVSIVNAPWTNYSAHPIGALDGHLVTRMLGRRLATRTFPFFKDALLWCWAFPYKLWRLRGRRRDVRTRTLFDVIEGDLTLLADVPEFSPTSALPPSVRYVGPVLWKARMAEPMWLGRLDPARPTVYVSMGSTGRQPLFETAARAFAGTDYQVMMTTGEIALAPGSLPPNVFATSFAPGERLLERAHVCVSHGGNGTLYQALTAGVPVVGIPTHVDQQIQMQLCEARGVGVQVPDSGLTPERLRQAVDTVRLDPRFRERAAAMSRAIARYGGARSAAAAIVELLERRQPGKARAARAAAV